MAYDAQIELVRTRLLASLPGGLTGLDTLELWNRYLTLQGFTQGTLLDRMAAAARASNRTLDNYIHYGPLGLGPELAPPFSDAGWTPTGTTPPTVDANGVVFTAASNIASAFHDTVPLEDNTLYEFTFTIDNYTNGGARIILSGATQAHGFTGTTRNAAGTYTERGRTENASTSSTLVRVQCTGTTGNNNFRVPSLSVKKVL